MFKHLNPNVDVFEKSSQKIYIDKYKYDFPCGCTRNIL